MQRRRQFSCREARLQTDDTQHEALRSGHAEGIAHSLRRAIEAMDHGPEEPHEPQHVWKRLDDNRSTTHRLF